jgi:tetratricopeptide (TPR) repeat protein
LKHKRSSLISQKNIFWEKTIELSIFLLIILVPLALYPCCITVFLPAKELVFKLLVVIALMFWGLRITSEEKLSFNHSPLNLPILSFISLSLLSLFWSNSFLLSITELPLFLAGPFLYFITINNINNEKQINTILNTVIILGSLFGIYGILQYLGIDFSFWGHNVGRQVVAGLFGNVNYFAEYLIAILPLAVSLFFITSIKSNRSKKILLLIGILAMGGSLLLTFTRGSYLAFGVSLIFMLLLFVICRGKVFIRENRKIFILILAAIILAAFLFAIPNPLNKPGTYISKIKARTSITALKEGYSSKRRMATWKFTWMMITDRPILGSGVGTFKYNTLSYQAKFFSQGNNRSLYPYGIAFNAHNEYLEVWAELGIIGLGIFLWMVIGYFYYGLKFLKKTKNNYKQGTVIGLMGAVVAILIDGIFGFPLHLPATAVLFWLFLGLTVSIIEREKVNFLEEKDNQKDFNQDKIDKRQKNGKLGNKRIKGVKNNPGNIYQYKIILSIIIICLAIFLSITLTRPFMARVNWYYGNRELGSGNWDKALKVFQKALKWDPYSGRMSYNIGKILREKGKYEEAQIYLERAEKTGSIPSLPLELGLVYYNQGLFEKSAEKFEKAISYQSEERSMAPIYVNLGTTYFRLKRTDLAENCYQNALKIEPNIIQAHFGMGLVYVEKKLWQKALEEFSIVTKLKPDSKEAKKAQEIIQQITQSENTE